MAVGVADLQRMRYTYGMTEREEMAARGFYTGAEALARFEDHTEAARKAGHDLGCYETMIEMADRRCRCEPELVESEL